MRSIDSELKAKFESNLQTKANDADPQAVIWISRPTVPLTDAEFLDRATVLQANGLTACDVAVRRPRADREADRVYLAYIDENGAHVKFSATEQRLEDYVWTDGGFSAAASDVAIAFDGTMPKKADGTAQFVTEERPWVFWINEGVLKGRILGLLGDVTLASANAEKVSAVRAAWAQATNVDFGLVCFFTLGGALYYRQLIGGEWKDAEPVTFGPPGVTWEDIRAFRTWDYRVGVQGLGSDGKVYELFTQFEGLARHGGEHIELDTRSVGTLIPVEYHDAQTREHLSLAAAASPGPYGGLYRTGAPQLVEAENIDTGGDWGRTALFRFDRHLDATEVAAQPTAFEIVDAYDRRFVAQTAAVDADGLTVRLGFLNFNGAFGTCTARYVPGTVHSMAGAALLATSCSFTPQNLVPPSVPVPALLSVENDGDTQIIVTFNRALTGSLTGAAPHFTASLSVPVYSPDGALHTETRTPVSVAASGSDTIVLTFAAGNLTDLTKSDGSITLVYDGAGPLAGEGGPVFPFSETFTPTGLTPKYDQNEAEHIELGVTASGTLTRIYYTYAQETEHISLGVTAAGTLTHIDDL